MSCRSPTITSGPVLFPQFEPLPGLMLNDPLKVVPAEKSPIWIM